MLEIETKSKKTKKNLIFINSSKSYRCKMRSSARGGVCGQYAAQGSAERNAADKLFQLLLASCEASTTV